MKKLFFGTLLLALAIAVPVPAMAEVDVNISIGLPPPFIFPAPPAVIVLPDTDYVYVDPDVDIELFFWNGWWWRPWEGRWYRSRYYDRGWVYYDNVPRFYFDVDPSWRRYTETIAGMDTDRIMNGFLTVDFIRTERAGMTIRIEKGGEPGVLRTIEIDQDHNRGSN